MATTYVYLSEEDMKKLAEGEKVEIQMTVGLKNSDRLFLQLDQTEKKEKE